MPSTYCLTSPLWIEAVRPGMGQLVFNGRTSAETGADSPGITGWTLLNETQPSGQRRMMSGSEGSLNEYSL